MIGRLRGTVEVIGEDWLILDVGGVGYEVACTARMLARVRVGDTLTLAIETHVREDAIRLFGFSGEIERRWFRLLQSVQGVGAKSALAIIGVLTPAELANAVALGDQAQVSRAPGVGPKVAARIVAELKDKAPRLMLQVQQIEEGEGEPAVPADGGAAGAENTAAAKPKRAPRGKATPPPADDGTLAIQADATSALVNLGHSLGDASQAVAQAMKAHVDAAAAQDEGADKPALSLQWVIKDALRRLLKG